MLALLAVAAVLPVEAQQARGVYRVGIIATSSTPPPDLVRLWEVFFNRLRDLGYVEGRNIVFERRFSEGRSERFPALATELTGLKVDVIMVFTTPAALAAKAATNTIPILFVNAIDPVGAGLAATLARPGRNVTGLTALSPELSTKRVQLLKEVVPGVSRVDVLWNAANPANALVLRQTEEAARYLGIILRSREVRRSDEFAERFATIEQDRPDALLVFGDALTFQHRHQIARFALEVRLPAIFEAREMAVVGGLMAYGPSYSENQRRAAVYVDRLLKGVKPADLPFEQPSKFELVINMTTARRLGLTIPPAVRLRADELIE
jgi:putative ABC transport system substrate-binding protein